MRLVITLNAKNAKAATKRMLCELSALCVPCRIEVSYATVHLHDEGPREGPPARHQVARRHLAVVLLRREDRRPRLARRRQELAAEDHGGRRHELHRRSIS